MNLTDTLAGTPDGAGGANRVYGVVSGLVTDNHDPEGRARVKLKFPWLAKDTESDWAKVVSFMAGKNRGAVFLPEVGDEVLVAFEHGDIHHPYVLGGLWNSEDSAPETNTSGKNNIRKIKSRSGHEIILDDSQGAEKIEIHDKTGKNIVIIDSVKGEISLESQMKLKLKSQVIEIESGMQMKITAGAVMEIKGALVKIN